MVITIFSVSAVLFGVFTVARLALLKYPQPSLDYALNILEKTGYILFTLGLAFYIYFLGEKDTPSFFVSLSDRRPLGWLLFNWCLYSAQVLTEIFYGVKSTKLFANFWLAAGLTVLPDASDGGIRTLFSSNLEWLSLHRLCFLIGYAFCVLGIAWTTIFLWKHWRVSQLPEEAQIQEQKNLWMLDRMQYRMVLWALPLLTLGLLLESFFLIEAGRFPSPAQIWMQQKESFLALATWFFCGFTLHTRLFFGWRDVRSSLFFMGAFYLVMLGHLSERFLHFH